MKVYVFILLLLVPLAILCQKGDTLKPNPNTLGQGLVNSNISKGATINPAQYKPEIFTSGFIDIINSGQVNASSRFIRLYIGEPGKFAIPLSLYSGVSSNNFQSTQTSFQRNNDILVTNFINPLSGLANVSVDGVLFFNNKSQKITKAGLIYHIGERILTGVRTGTASNPATGKPHNFLNAFGATGLYFQTGAWEKNNTRNVGVSWFALRYILCYTKPRELEEFLPNIRTSGFYNGYSIAWGVEITRIVNIRVVYYKYIKKPEIDYYLPIYQFSFNYTLK